MSRQMDLRIERSILLEPLETSQEELKRDNYVAVECERMEREEFGRLAY